jgi:hypothetical protein
MQKSKEFKVFSPEGGYEVIRRISRLQAEAMEAKGALQRECDATGTALLGFRVIGSRANFLTLLREGNRSDAEI